MQISAIPLRNGFQKAIVLDSSIQITGSLLDLFDLQNNGVFAETTFCGSYYRGGTTPLVTPIKGNAPCRHSEI